jgi:hypothetical protein
VVKVFSSGAAGASLVARGSVCVLVVGAKPAIETALATKTKVRTTHRTTVLKCLKAGFPRVCMLSVILLYLPLGAVVFQADIVVLSLLSYNINLRNCSVIKIILMQYKTNYMNEI